MIYLTGDTHGDWRRFSTSNFPDQKEMTRDDIVIVCGDFGIWHDTKEERYWLNWLAEKPFTVCFVDGNHECLHKNTEILTDKGWISIEDAYENYDSIKVASVNNENKITYDKPLNRIKKYADNLLLVDGCSFKQCVTYDHDVILNEKKIKAENIIGKDYRVSDFRYHINNDLNYLDLSNEMIEILTAVIMDATIVDYKKYNKNSEKVRIQFHFKKKRKIVYLENLLSNNNISYTIRYYDKDDSWFINIYGDDARKIYNLLGRKKQIPFEWSKMNIDQFKHFSNALINTDGSSVNETIVWRTISKNDIDIISEVCIRNNYDCNVMILNNHASGYKSDKIQYRMCYGINKRLDHKIKTENILYNDYVFCLTTKNGNLITRYEMNPVITGNCFDRLYSGEFEEIDYCGGKAHKIRDNIYHLERGYVFEICGKKIFAFGGASSHDIDDGILDRDDYVNDDDFYDACYRYRKYGKSFRINHLSWWKEELPSQEEMDRGIDSLNKVGWKVDYVVTHCAPQQIASIISNGFYGSDKLTMYFNGLLDKGIQFDSWFFGHYHDSRRIMSKFYLLYGEIMRIE